MFVQVHILNKWMVQLGMVLLKYLSIDLVDKIVLTLSKLKYGNLSSFGIERPNKGPFFLKRTTGRSPVIDVGTVAKIQANKIKVHTLTHLRKLYCMRMSILHINFTHEQAHIFFFFIT